MGRLDDLGKLAKGTDQLGKSAEAINAGTNADASSNISKIYAHSQFNDFSASATRAMKGKNSSTDLIRLLESAEQNFNTVDSKGFPNGHPELVAAYAQFRAVFEVAHTYVTDGEGKNPKTNWCGNNTETDSTPRKILRENLVPSLEASVVATEKKCMDRAITQFNLDADELFEKLVNPAKQDGSNDKLMDVFTKYKIGKSLTLETVGDLKSDDIFAQDLTRVSLMDLATKVEKAVTDRDNYANHHCPNYQTNKSVEVDKQIEKSRKGFAKINEVVCFCQALLVRFQSIHTLAIKEKQQARSNGRTTAAQQVLTELKPSALRSIFDVYFNHPSRSAANPYRFISKGFGKPDIDLLSTGAYRLKQFIDTLPAQSDAQFTDEQIKSLANIIADRLASTSSAAGVGIDIDQVGQHLHQSQSMFVRIAALKLPETQHSYSNDVFSSFVLSAITKFISDDTVYAGVHSRFTNLFPNHSQECLANNSKHQQSNGKASPQVQPSVNAEEHFSDGRNMDISTTVGSASPALWLANTNGRMASALAKTNGFEAALGLPGQNGRKR